MACVKLVGIELPRNRVAVGRQSGSWDSPIGTFRMARCPLSEGPPNIEPVVLDRALQSMLTGGSGPYHFCVRV